MLWLAACAHTGPGAGGEQARARGALESFLEASERREFDAVWRLLSSDLRARYTPQRLAKDFGAEPLASERLARARAGLQATELDVDGDRASLPLGTERAVTLVRERDGWKVAALE